MLHTAQDSVQWLAFMNTIESSGSITGGEFLTS
jgi:hypothetical protein